MQRRRVVHYHLVIWFPASQQGLVANPLTARTIASLWHLVSDPDSRANGEWGARVEQVESIKRIRLYVAGYLSDVRRGDDVPGGRQWGYSRALKRGPLVAHTLPSIDSEALVAALRRVLLARTTRPDWVRGYTRACSVVVVYMDWREAAELLYGELRISPSEPQPPPGGIDL